MQRPKRAAHLVEADFVEQQGQVQRHDGRVGCGCEQDQVCRAEKHRISANRRSICLAHMHCDVLVRRAIVLQLRRVCQQLAPAHVTAAGACVCMSLVTLHRQRNLLDVAHRLRQVDAGGTRQVVRCAERRGCSAQGWVSSGRCKCTTDARSTAVATAGLVDSRRQHWAAQPCMAARVQQPQGNGPVVLHSAPALLQLTH
jgi:hypothetical protein